MRLDSYVFNNEINYKEKSANTTTNNYRYRSTCIVVITLVDEYGIVSFYNNFIVSYTLHSTCYLYVCTSSYIKMDTFLYQYSI